jgi:hypothetical protein
VKGNDRCLVPLENDEVQTIGERELSDPFFEIFQRLRREQQRAQDEYGGTEGGGSHAASTIVTGGGGIGFQP